ncbi:hypothetical protein, partial [Corynebacterium sp. ACRPS]|uniref:hypothetical protein n=1 Tax=Corynebacterium sp. ACRPS TaxID=2918194 RepID=UPI001EF515D2|nr:hypothetical protein [Corynebacterium sp. ACRPS]
REKPKPNQKNKPPHTHKSRPMLASKNYYKEKITASPTRRGKKGRQKVEHNHMPTNPSMQPKH